MRGRGGGGGGGMDVRIFSHFFRNFAIFAFFAIAFCLSALRA